MKKRIIGLVAITALALGLAGCGNKENKKAGEEKVKETTSLKIGASPTPHAEILEYVQPKLKEEGIELEIVKFDDYIMPNRALDEGEIDANYFQHIPYFESSVKENDFDFVNASKVHIELMSLYSKRIKDIKELKDGATIMTSNSESDWGRIITILQDAGLVEVKKGTDLLTATFEDIDKNPKNLKFVHNVNADLLATAYENDEADLVAINANFAAGVGLVPEKDGILVEKDNSPYANIIAVRTEDKDNKALKKLIKVLHEKDTQDWINEKWDGQMKPVND